MSARTSVIAPAAALYSAIALTRAAKVWATPTETGSWAGGDTVAAGVVGMDRGRTDLGADTGNGVGTDLDVGHEFPLHGR